MDVWMVILRLIHIFAGVFWAGATFMMISFIGPAIQATGAEGQAFMRQLGLKSKYGTTMFVAGTLTALSGLIMYFILFGFGADAASSTYSIVLGFGALVGIAAWILGYIYQGRSISRMKAINSEIEAAGSPPSPEQLAEMQAQAERINFGTRITATLVTISLVGMSVAQYVG